MSEWIKHDGGECPVPENTIVVVRYWDCIPSGECRAGDIRWQWDYDGEGGMDIAAFRIVGTKQDGVPVKELEQKHSHYYKDCPYDKIDIYRVLDIFNVTDPCLQHVAKKALVAGGRGHKNIDKDIQDCIDTLVRWQAMRKEDEECLNKP